MNKDTIVEVCIIDQYFPVYYREAALKPSLLHEVHIAIDHI